MSEGYSLEDFRNEKNFVKKSGELLTDTTGTIESDQAMPPMPPPVDISDYKPPFIKEQEREVEVATTVDKPKILSKEETNTLLREDIILFGKTFLGTPYKYAGKKPETGFDCSGFTAYVYKQFGIQLSPASRFQANDGIAVDLDKVTTGDLILFGKNAKVNHVGIVVERKESNIFVIHSTSRGVVVDNISQSTYWKQRILFARRIIY